MGDRIFGEIPGIYVGQEFVNRLELSRSRVHPPNQKGISGTPKDGADSIVISGGYEDDQDYGDIVIYTGEGGRSENSRKQTTNQLLVGGNLALAKSCQLGLPVRVTRGATHRSSFSPEKGYRYDGLFFIDSYWKEKGKSGFDVWKYRLIKIKDGESQTLVEDSIEEYGKVNPTRKQYTIQRIVRDTEVGRRVKRLYDYHCQVCNERIETNAGFYAEAAHIQPLGSPHNGPDVLSNVLCLCPNHHAMFDFGGFAIEDDYSLIGIQGKLLRKPEHQLDVSCIKYHRQRFWGE